MGAGGSTTEGLAAGVIVASEQATASPEAVARDAAAINATDLILICQFLPC
jgi:hypothetical protein